MGKKKKKLGLTLSNGVSGQPGKSCLTSQKQPERPWTQLLTCQGKSRFCHRDPLDHLLGQASGIASSCPTLQGCVRGESLGTCPSAGIPNWNRTQRCWAGDTRLCGQGCSPSALERPAPNGRREGFQPPPEKQRSIFWNRQRLQKAGEMHTWQPLAAGLPGAKVSIPPILELRRQEKIRDT